MESISDGVLTLDREERITHINERAGLSLGIDLKNAVGIKLRDLMDPDNELFFSKVLGNKKLYSEPIIVRRAHDNVKLAISCTPLKNQEGLVLGTTIILHPMQHYKQLIKRASGSRPHITFNNIIGKSPEFKKAVECAQLAAKSDSNVLLLGESGVGKEIFAQSIHNASSRAREPFLAINCAALPRELVSSELFGYEEGAFTGARKGGNPGKFELADQGTLFLDEIGEMPLELQGTLLRVLEEGTIVRLGGSDIIPVNVRIIAATNKNLLEEVEKKNFRADLYYRLGVIDINIPPLRERREDIPELLSHFITMMGPKFGKEIKGISKEALDILLNYEWPGNVRELSNVIERAINLTNENILTIKVLPEYLTRNYKKHVSYQKPVPERIDEHMIKECLKKNKDNRSRAAKELGISRSSLYRKLKKYSLT